MARDRYKEMGVASDKRSVTRIFEASNESVFQNAFCVIGWDPVLRVYDILHGDGSGSKSIARLLCFLETGDPEFLIPDYFDAFSMNAGDDATCGFFDIYKVINIKAVNGKLIDKAAVIAAVAEAEKRLKKQYAGYGIRVEIRGGETADLLNQTENYIIDAAVYTYLSERDRIIKGNIEVGDNIWGFRSDGQAIWEKEFNFGLMSNGLTLVQAVIFHKSYNEKYPHLARTNPFEGRFYVGDRMPGTNVTVAEAVLSPTRQWAILIKMLIEELESTDNLHLLHGISMNTGGGATKIRNIGSHICYRKKMPKLSPIFRLIQKESGQPSRDMFTALNCGIGIDVVGDPKGGILEKAIRATSRKSNVRSLLLGDCTRSKSKENFVKLKTPYGNFNYK